MADLTERSLSATQRCLIQGNEACALAALASGCRFYAGYPITPSSEIAEFMAHRLAELGGTFIQMEDEIASLAACIGASLCGVRAMTATSGPGFSLMQENIGFACLAEVPVVVVNVQRVGPSTGMPTLPAQGDVMQARWGTHGDHPAVVLVPASVGEFYGLTAQAFQLAELLRTPVIVLADEAVGHLREVVTLPDAPAPTPSSAPSLPPGQAYRPYRVSRPEEVPPMAVFGSGHRFHVTGLYHDEDGFPTNDPVVAERLIRRIHRKVEARQDLLTMVARFALDDAEVAVVTYGAPTRAAMRAVRQARAQGVRAGLLQLMCIWPFPAAQVRALAERVRAVVVPELNLGQLCLEVERAVAGRVPVVALSKVGGQLFTPGEICEALAALRCEHGVREDGQPSYSACPGWRREVRLAGEGGQGLVQAGVMLGEAAGVVEGWHVAQTQTYGPESRGGASWADVIVSEQEIDDPRATALDALLAMSQEACDRFAGALRPGGWLVYDRERVRPPQQQGAAGPQGAHGAAGADKGVRLVGLPLSAEARKLWDRPMLATVVGLGVLAALSGVVSRSALEQAVARRAPPGTAELNLAALRRGFEMARLRPEAA